MTTFNVEYFNKYTNVWAVAEDGFATEKKAIAAMNKRAKKFPVPVRVVEATEYQGHFKVGSKIRVTSVSNRTDGLVDKQVFIAVIVKNNGDRAEYETVEHEVEENVLRKIGSGGFVVGMAHLMEIEAI